MSLTSDLELLSVASEIRLGFLFVSVAEMAYKVRDFDGADHTRAKGEAVYFRANRLLTQIADGDRKQVLADLERLNIALGCLKICPYDSPIDHIDPEAKSIGSPERSHTYLGARFLAYLRVKFTPK
jgi:hypothetical protein